MKLVLCWAQNKFFLVYESLYICFPFIHQIYNLYAPGNPLGGHCASIVQVSLPCLAPMLVRSPTWFVFGIRLNMIDTKQQPCELILLNSQHPCSHCSALNATEISVSLVESHSVTYLGLFSASYSLSKIALCFNLFVPLPAPLLSFVENRSRDQKPHRHLVSCTFVIPTSCTYYYHRWNPLLASSRSFTQFMIEMDVSTFALYCTKVLSLQMPWTALK